MRIINSIFIAFSMFSRIPSPNVVWSKSNMKYAMCAFPLVGAVIGALLFALTWVCGKFSVSPIISAALLTALPVIITGGIHLDGFCDTVDALSSRAPAEKKREILKDPRCGAFAVIWVCVYMITYFALSSQLAFDLIGILPVAIMFVLSRSLSGLCVTLMSTSSSKGLADTFQRLASKKAVCTVLIIFIVVSSAALIFTGTLRGGFMLLAALLCVLRLCYIAKKEFGGMSGDLAGYFLQICELSMLFAFVLSDILLTA